MFNYFYHGTTRNYISVFGSLFNNIQVRREDGKQILVPIGFANREKYIAKFNSNLYKDNTGLPENLNDYPIDPNQPLPTSDITNIEIETILPRMGYSLSSMQYDPSRKTNLNNKNRFTKADGSRNSVLNGVPYMLSLELDIYARYEDDMLQIVEQIIPYFQPHFNVAITDLKSGDDTVINKRDISINLETVQPEEDIEGAGDQRRILQWSLTFLLKGYYYPAISENIKEIKTTINNLVGVEQIITDVAQLDNFASTTEGVDWNVEPITANEVDNPDEVSTWNLPS